MAHTPQHYLYPLNPKSVQGYHFIDDRGNDYPTSIEGFFDCYQGTSFGEWTVSFLAGSLRKDDFIWIHFALPISAILAVGRVANAPKFNRDNEKPLVKIKWDWKLTKRLQNDPIPYSAHKQRIPGAVQAANPKTTQVIEQWLSKKIVPQSVVVPRKVEFTTVEVERRQGQPGFRHALMSVYNYKCAVTGCEVRDVLQAAHIIPVADGGQHAVQNGLLLRADIHNLFDRGLLTIDPQYRIQLHPIVLNSNSYRALHGKKLRNIPLNKADRPSLKNLKEHQKWHQELS
jgi:hypothetical protein